MSNSDYRQFSSYNGLDRVPQFMGLPMSAFLVVFVITAILTVLAIVILGLVGFLFIVVGLPIFLFLQQITATDDQAIRVLLYELMFSSRRHLYKEFGNTLTFHPTDYLKNDGIQQYLEKSTFYDE